MADNNPTSPPLPTPTILLAQEDGKDDDKKGLTSGQIGAILATITIVFILLLASLHLYLSRRRRRLQHPSPHQPPHIYSYYNDDDSSELDSDWSSRATRQNIRVRETVERVDVNWADDRRRGNLRRGPERHQIRSWQRTAPVYSNVRHVRRPEAGYFRS